MQLWIRLAEFILNHKWINDYDAYVFACQQMPHSSSQVLNLLMEHWTWIQRLILVNLLITSTSSKWLVFSIAFRCWLRTKLSPWKRTNQVWSELNGWIIFKYSPSPQQIIAPPNNLKISYTIIFPRFERQRKISHGINNPNSMFLSSLETIE